MATRIDPVVHTIHEKSTGTWQYIVADPQTKKAVIIDSVLDFDSANNKVSTNSADEVLAKALQEGYEIDSLLETHLHADHLSAASYLREQLKAKQATPPKICIGNGIERMQKLFGTRYGVPDSEWSDAFDRTYADGEKFSIGDLEAEVMHLPGHTPDHIGYVIGKNVFTGDSIFNPDLGSARCDFPHGSAAALWQSMQRLLHLPPDYKLYTGHDYPPATRVTPEGEGLARPFATVQEHKESNKHVKDGTLEENFVEMRTTRDAGLNEPKLINQALQFNIRGGKLPKLSTAGDRLLHIPVKIPESLVTA